MPFEVWNDSSFKHMRVSYELDIPPEILGVPGIPWITARGHAGTVGTPNIHPLESVYGNIKDD